MIDPRPDFESETLTPYEIFQRNSSSFGFQMKSWAQPFYGGSIVVVKGWLHWELRDDKRVAVARAEPSEWFDVHTKSFKPLESFVCSRMPDSNDFLLVIENIHGKGWLPHSSKSL